MMLLSSVMTHIDLIAVCATILFLVVQLYYAIVIYGRPLMLNEKNKNLIYTKEQLPPVSVIVYSYGDAEKLELNLPYILEQNYPDFEVIVVNDGNDSDCEDALKRLSAKYSNLYYTYVPVDTQYLSHKKLAITMALKAAKHEIVLFTEGNCRPSTNNWIRSFAEHYKPGVDVVLGYCAYDIGKDWIQKLISFENLKSGLEYLSNALAHYPYSGDGRNMSYRKSIFFSHKGFSKTLNLHVGADSLFINEVANGNNCRCVYSPDSIVKMNKLDDVAEYSDAKRLSDRAKGFMKGFAPSKYAAKVILAYLLHIAAIASIMIGLFGNWVVSVVGLLSIVIYFVAYGIVYNQSSKMMTQGPLKFWIIILLIARPLFGFILSSRRTASSDDIFTTY